MKKQLTIARELVSDSEILILESSSLQRGLTLRYEIITDRVLPIFQHLKQLLLVAQALPNHGRQNQLRLY